MALRRSVLDLHRQTSAFKSLPFSMSHISAASSPTTVVRNPIGRDLSSIPFSLTQNLKHDSTNRSISSIRQSDLEMAKNFTRLQSSRGYTTRSYLPKLHLLYHINEGMEEILADYVHQEMTRNLMVISLGLFQFIVIKDVFVFLFY